MMRVKAVIVLMVSRRARWMVSRLVGIEGVASWVVRLLMVIVRVLPVTVQIVAVHVCLSPDVVMVMVFRNMVLLCIRVDLMVHVEVAIWSIHWHVDSVCVCVQILKLQGICFVVMIMFIYVIV